MVLKNEFLSNLKTLISYVKINLVIKVTLSLSMKIESDLSYLRLGCNFPSSNAFLKLLERSSGRSLNV